MIPAVKGVGAANEEWGMRTASQRYRLQLVWITVEYGLVVVVDRVVAMPTRIVSAPPRTVQPWWRQVLSLTMADMIQRYIIV
jgi:hypothetical protein